MTEVLLHHLIGRTVRDADGKRLGRIEELCAEIEMTDRGNDYVVVSYLIGAYGALAGVAGTTFARHLLRWFGRSSNYRIPWDWMDLGDPARPRCTRTKAEVQEA